MKYQKRRHWKYRLYEDVFYRHTDITPAQPVDTEFINLTSEGSLLVKAGYVWDGASGPTIDTKNTMTASLIHDALYNLLRDGLIDQKWRKRADQVLYELLRQSGMSKIRAKIWFRAVRKGAAHAAEYDVLTAP